MILYYWRVINDHVFSIDSIINNFTIQNQYKLYSLYSVFSTQNFVSSFYYSNFCIQILVLKNSDSEFCIQTFGTQNLVSHFYYSNALNLDLNTFIGKTFILKVDVFNVVVLKLIIFKVIDLKVLIINSIIQSCIWLQLQFDSFIFEIILIMIY